MEKLSEVVIDDQDFSEILIGGKKFEPLCEYVMEGGKKAEVSAYFNPIDLDVVVVLKEPDAPLKAIVDLFSLREDDVPKFVGFVDMTLSKKEDFTMYNRDIFPKCVMDVMEQGGVCPTLSKSKMVSSELSGYTGNQPSLIEKIYAGLQRKEKQEELQALMEKHMVSAVYVTPEKEAYVVQKSEEELLNRPHYVSASSLPEGWRWEKFDDGSGSLFGPNGEDYFSYDLTTVPGGIEYKISSNQSWGSFVGSFSEFQAFAESFVKEQFLSLNAKIKKAVPDKGQRAGEKDTQREMVRSGDVWRG